MWCGEMTVPSTTNQACQSTARLTSSLSDSLTTTYPFCLRVETLASIGITAHFALQKRPEPKLPSWFLPHACTPPPTRRQHTARHWFRDDIMSRAPVVGRLCVALTSQLKRKPDCCAGCGLSARLSAADTHRRGSTE